MKKNLFQTKKQYETLYQVYHYFNCTLFEGKLPGCFLNFSRGRSRKTMGFFRPHRWTRREYEKEGEVYWSFGKHRNELVSKTVSYAKWVLDNDFPEDTKRRIRELGWGGGLVFF